MPRARACIDKMHTMWGREQPLGPNTFTLGSAGVEWQLQLAPRAAVGVAHKMVHAIVDVAHARAADVHRDDGNVCERQGGGRREVAALLTARQPA